MSVCSVFVSVYRYFLVFCMDLLKFKYYPHKNNIIIIFLTSAKLLFRATSHSRIIDATDPKCLLIM